MVTLCGQQRQNSCGVHSLVSPNSHFNSTKSAASAAPAASATRPHQPHQPHQPHPPHPPHQRISRIRRISRINGNSSNLSNNINNRCMPMRLMCHSQESCLSSSEPYPRKTRSGAGIARAVYALAEFITSRGGRIVSHDVARQFRLSVPSCESAQRCLGGSTCQVEHDQDHRRSSGSGCLARGAGQTLSF